MSKKRIALFLALMLITAPAALAQPYQDGVYRDLGPGYNDEVVVTVTVRGGEMTELTAENRGGGEKSEYFVKAEEGLSKAILEKQSIDGVDAVMRERFYDAVVEARRREPQRTFLISTHLIDEVARTLDYACLLYTSRCV